MNLLLLRSSTAASVPNNGVTVLLASGALALMLLLASGMKPWSSSPAPAVAAQPTVPAGEPTLFEQVRHELVTGA
ncbi:MAG: hypothetical protein ABIS28_13615 [Caldimonas sp.]